MKTSIPIYRAKKIDSDEYVTFEGKLTYNESMFAVYATSKGDAVLQLVDQSTLAIHFPDMIAKDSDRILPNGEKDLRIFASLSEDGKGGDILEDTAGYKWNVFMRFGCVCLNTKQGHGKGNFEYDKIIGIQQ